MTGKGWWLAFGRRSCVARCVLEEVFAKVGDVHGVVGVGGGVGGEAEFAVEGLGGVHGGGLGVEDGGAEAAGVGVMEGGLDELLGDAASAVVREDEEAFELAGLKFCWRCAEGYTADGMSMSRARRSSPFSEV